MDRGTSEVETALAVFAPAGTSALEEGLYTILPNKKDNGFGTGALGLMSKNPRDDIVTLEDLQMAIANRIGIPEEEAQRDANFVLDIFGFDDRVIDNVLEPEDRQLFYMLEEEGMLTTEREETTLYDGREWRTHYWLFKKEAIKDMSEKEREARRLKRNLPSEEDVYKALPEELWSSRTL